MKKILPTVKSEQDFLYVILIRFCFQHCPQVWVSFFLRAENKSAETENYRRRNADNDCRVALGKSRANGGGRSRWRSLLRNQQQQNRSSE